MDELWRRSATELATLIAERQVTSREVVEEHLARIDAVNGHVNAVTETMAESALAAADVADRAPAAGPLHGVPFTVKQNIDCVGSPTTHGVPALRHAFPWCDAPSVSRLRAAGAIVLGRTNLSELGLRVCADNPLHGRTRNPWDPSLTPGGSSGGDAAALATGMTPLGLGNDAGGSLRSPACCCGVAALKPTTGRIPRASSLPPFDHGWAMQYMAVEGPIARSVVDLRIALSIMAGRDVRDPRSVDAPLQSPGGQGRRRAALVLHVPGADIPPPTLSAIGRAGEILAAAGWEVEHVDPPEIDLVDRTWSELMATDLAVILERTGPVLSPPLRDYVRRFCRWRDVRGTPDHELHATRSFLGRLWSEFFQHYSVAVGPTWTQTPWPSDADLDPEEGLQLVADATRFILPANVLGLPAVAIPAGIGAGMPTSVQIYADLWREDLCLDAAQTIEDAVGAPCPIDPVT